jgi:RND family efflux transporter MFP subunit
LVQDSQDSVPVTYTGTVIPAQRASISSKVMAQVDEVNFQAGSRVHQGELLIGLKANDLQAQAAQAEAQVSSARAGLNQARVAYQEARTDFDRYRSLYLSGAISQYDYQHARDKTAEEKAAVSQAEADLATDRADYAYADAMVGYTGIYAPFSGIIVKKEVNVGDMAVQGEELCVEESGPYRLEVPVPESYESRITAGSSVLVDIPAGDAQFSGVVTRVVPAVSPGSMTYQVKILLPDSLPVKSGMYGSATFTAGTARDIFIPDTAVIKWGDFDGVFVDDHGVATLNYVTMGQTVGDRVQVLSGLSANQKVVTDPYNLEDGEKIVGGIDQ